VSGTDNEALISRYVDELNSRNFSVLDELVADEVDFGDRMVTRAGYRQEILDRIAAMPDYRVTIEDASADRNGVTIRWRYRGTVSGKDGAQASEVEGAARSTYLIEGGRIVGVRAENA
jgi:predicted ester cyclase